MHLTSPLRRGALAAAFALSIATAAIAADETTIRVRTAAGAIERVTIEDIGGLAVGEGRALTTDAGQYALLRRETGRYVLEVAGERFELEDFAATEPAHADGLAAQHGGKRVIVRHRHDGKSTADASGERRIVRIVERDGSAAGTMRDGEDMPLALEGLGTDGEVPRVTVVRRVTQEPAATK